jgi:hypothetical protein
LWIIQPTLWLVCLLICVDHGLGKTDGKDRIRVLPDVIDNIQTVNSQDRGIELSSFGSITCINIQPSRERMGACLSLLFTVAEGGPHILSLEPLVLNSVSSCNSMGVASVGLSSNGIKPPVFCVVQQRIFILSGFLLTAGKLLVIVERSRNKKDGSEQNIARNCSRASSS